MKNRIFVLAGLVVVLFAGIVLAESITKDMWDTGTYGTATFTGDSSSKTTTLTVTNLTVTGTVTAGSIAGSVSGIVTATSITNSGNTVLGDSSNDTVTALAWFQGITNAGNLVQGTVTNQVMAGVGWRVTPLELRSSLNVAGGLTSAAAVVTGQFTPSGNSTIADSTNDVVLATLPTVAGGGTSFLQSGQIYQSNGVLRIF